MGTREGLSPRAGKPALHFHCATGLFVSPKDSRACCTQAADRDTGALINYCKFGWPVKTKLPPNLKSYWTVRGRLTLHDDLLLYGSRIVIPQDLRQETMQKIHQGHQGILNVDFGWNQQCGGLGFQMKLKILSSSVTRDWCRELVRYVQLK